MSPATRPKGKVREIQTMSTQAAKGYSQRGGSGLNRRKKTKRNMGLLIHCWPTEAWQTGGEGDAGKRDKHR